MRVAEIDKGFVRAPPEEVYAIVRHPAGYPGWWPRVRADGEGLRFPVLGSVSVGTAGVREGIELLVTVAQAQHKSG